MEELPIYTIHEHAACMRCQTVGAINVRGWLFYCPPCWEQALEEED